MDIINSPHFAELCLRAAIGADGINRKIASVFLSDRPTRSGGRLNGEINKNKNRNGGRLSCGCGSDDDDDGDNNNVICVVNDVRRTMCVLHCCCHLKFIDVITTQFCFTTK